MKQFIRRNIIFSFLGIGVCCLLLRFFSILGMILDYNESRTSNTNISLLRKRQQRRLFTSRVGSPDFTGFYANQLSWFERLSDVRFKLCEEAKRNAKLNAANFTGPGIGLGVTVYFDPKNYLERLLRSIDIELGVLVITHYESSIDNVSGTETLLEHLRAFTSEDGNRKVQIPFLRNLMARRIVVNSYPTNMGCAFGMNEVFFSAPEADWWLIVNNDIAFPKGVLRNVASSVYHELHSERHDRLYRKEPLAIMTFTFVYGGNNIFSNFAVTRRSLADVGVLDENFFPAYAEDMDYMHRVFKILGHGSIKRREKP